MLDEDRLQRINEALITSARPAGVTRKGSPDLFAVLDDADSSAHAAAAGLGLRLIYDPRTEAYFAVPESEESRFAIRTSELRADLSRKLDRNAVGRADLYLSEMAVVHLVLLHELFQGPQKGGSISRVALYDAVTRAFTKNKAAYEGVPDDMRPWVYEVAVNYIDRRAAPKDPEDYADRGFTRTRCGIVNYLLIYLASFDLLDITPDFINLTDRGRVVMRQMSLSSERADLYDAVFSATDKRFGSDRTGKEL